jgi:exonuclease III
MRIATWNVQNINYKLKEVMAELEKHRIDIVMLTETMKK